MRISCTWLVVTSATPHVNDIWLHLPGACSDGSADARYSPPGKTDDPIPTDDKSISHGFSFEGRRA